MRSSLLFGTWWTPIRQQATCFPSISLLYKLRRKHRIADSAYHDRHEIHDASFLVWNRSLSSRSQTKLNHCQLYQRDGRYIEHSLWSLRSSAFYPGNLDALSPVESMRWIYRTINRTVLWENELLMLMTMCKKSPKHVKDMQTKDTTAHGLHNTIKNCEWCLNILSRQIKLCCSLRG